MRLLVFIVSLLLSHYVMAQFGPGGVGNSSNNGLWLKADQIEGYNDGDNVPTWEDQSGNGNDAANTTVGEQPQYYSTSAINNRPVIRFDGGDQMIVPDANILDGSAGLTYFSVLRRLGTGGAKGIIGKRITFTTNVNYAYTFFFWNGNRVNLDIHTQNNRFDAPPAFTAGNNYMPAFVYDGSLINNQRSKIYESGNLLETSLEASSSLPNSNQDLCIGALNVNYGQYLNADMAELIHYNFALNSAQRKIVENYLGAKYGLAVDTEYYTFDATYGNEVAGIGRDDASNFHDDAQGSARVRINTPSSLDNGDYLLWGHDAGNITNNNIVDVDGALIQSRLNRVWRIQETGDVGTVTVTFDVSGFTGYQISDMRLLIDRNGNGFLDNDVTPIVGASAGAGLVQFTLVDFQDGDFFTLGSINSTQTPLPLELTDFQVENHKREVRTFWETASEVNVSHFEVIRSIDALQWKTVGEVEAVGNSSSQQLYQWNDDAPLDGLSYYRLKSVDFDGSVTYSDIRSVYRKEEKWEFTIYPNPGKGQFHLSTPQNLENIQLQVFDTHSKPMSFDILFKEGSEMVIDLNNASKGIYFLMLNTGSESVVKKLIIQ